MNWIGIRKKKEIPPEKKVLRAKIIVTALAVIALIVILRPAGKAPAQSNMSDLERDMNVTLDSLIRDLGFDKYEVYHVGEIETLTQQLDCPEEDEIVRLELRRDIIENTPGLSDGEKITKIEEIMSTIDQLKIQVERFYANPKTSATYYSRRIRFSTPDGRKHTFFQQVMNGYYRTKYYKEVSGSENPQAEYDKLKQTTDQTR